MNAVRFSYGGEVLGPLVAKLAAELEQGDFTKPRTLGVLFKVYDRTLAGVCGLVPDLYRERDPHAGRLRHYVLPARRVAKLLGTTVIDEARRHYRVLRLHTANPAAARLYETSGFAAVTEPAAARALELP